MGILFGSFFFCCCWSSIQQAIHWTRIESASLFLCCTHTIANHSTPLHSKSITHFLIQCESKENVYKSSTKHSAYRNVLHSGHYGWKLPTHPGGGKYYLLENTMQMCQITFHNSLHNNVKNLDQFLRVGEGPILRTFQDLRYLSLWQWAKWEGMEILEDFEDKH